EINYLFSMKHRLFKCLFFSGLILILSSCEPKESNPYLLESIIEINIDLSNNRDLPLSELFREIEYVTLNTPENQIIGPFVKKIIQDDKIALFDNQNSSMWVFNTEGEYLNRIEIKNGRGPGEVMHLSDMTFASNNTIHALGAMKVLKFDLSGNLLNEFLFNGAVYQLSYFIEEGLYAGFANNSFNIGFDEVSGKNLLIFDEYGTVVDGFLPIDERFDGLIYSTFNNFPVYGNTQLLFIHLIDKIFEISPDGVRTRYTLNFGKNSIPDEIFDHMSRYRRPLDFYRSEVVDNDYVAYIVQVGEVKNKLLLTVRMNHQNYTVIFNKETHNTTVHKNIINDIDFGFFPNLYTVHDNKLFARIEAIDIINRAKKLRESDIMISPEIASFLKLSESLTVESNPVLLIGTFH
ncbi:MAG: 6-bladed beta-propeller, partial [Balneolaceae bacterium]